MAVSEYERKSVNKLTDDIEKYNVKWVEGCLCEQKIM